MKKDDPAYDRSQWLRPMKLREYYVDHVVSDVHEAEKQLYLAVIKGEVRAKSKGIVLGPEWLKQLEKFENDDPFTLPPDIELSVEDAKRKWPRNP
jgi:hypothetical protein